MFLKQKRTGQIKGRGCVDGRKQRLYTPKDEASSPTVATESVLLSCVIDAKERRDVATVDIPGAFMQGDQDETVHMRLEGTLAELLIKCDPPSFIVNMWSLRTASPCYTSNCSRPYMGPYELL